MARSESEPVRPARALWGFYASITTAKVEWMRCSRSSTQDDVLEAADRKHPTRRERYRCSSLGTSIARTEEVLSLAPGKTVAWVGAAVSQVRSRTRTRLSIRMQRRALAARSRGLRSKASAETSSSSSRSRHSPLIEETFATSAGRHLEEVKIADEAAASRDYQPGQRS